MSLHMKNNCRSVSSFQRFEHWKDYFWFKFWNLKTRQWQIPLHKIFFGWSLVYRTYLIIHRTEYLSKNVRYLTLTVRANKIAIYFEPVVRRCCALKNFAKFIGKHLYQSLFFNKVAGLRPVTLSRKKLWHKCFPVNFTKFFKTPFLKEHLRWLPVSLKLLTLQLEILAVISEK